MRQRTAAVLSSLPILALLLSVLALTGACEASSANSTVPVAYVASSGNNHVRIVDLASGETVRKIYSGAGPWRLVPSPDASRLWVQHWYAGTTAIIDRDEHRIVQVLPFRGPGAFSADGSAFYTFDWPRGGLHRIGEVDGRHPRVTDERTTVVREAYDVTPGPSGRLLYVAQYDPVARGPVPRYSAVAALDPTPPGEGEDAPTPRPASVATGLSPLQVVTVPGQPFVLTADSGTNGMTIINELGDRRALAVCAAPREILLAPDTSRMVVLCWDDRGRHASRAVSFRTDFSARPWPSIDREEETEIQGGLVAGAFDPTGGSVYAVDRPGGRLLELALPALDLVRTIDAGSEPMDVVILPTERADVDDLGSEAGPEREMLHAALDLAREGQPPFEDLSWTETITWLEDSTAPEAVEEPGEDTSEDGEDGEEAETEPPAEPIERSRTVRLTIQPPDALRTELPEGGSRVARGGVSITMDQDGRFWTAPRQDLATAVYNLPSLDREEAVRQLSGDVPESPFLRGGLALDVVSEVREGGQRFYVIGALPGSGESTASGDDVPEAPRVAQLWIDAETGRPTNLIEQFPVFERSEHGQGAAPEVAETKFYEWAPVAEDGPMMPRRLERIVEGEWLQHVQLADFRLNRSPDPVLLDATRLGGLEPAPGRVFRRDAVSAEAGTQGEPAQDGPGRATPTHLPPEPLGSPLAPHTPYATTPPTSGPYLPFTGAWGVHPVPMPLPLQVHNLLDGGVALQYDCPEGCPDLVRALEEIARGHDFVIMAPYPWLPGDVRVAASAWGHLATFDDEALADSGWTERVEAFVSAYAGTSHHRTGGHPTLAPSHDGP